MYGFTLVCTRTMWSVRDVNYILARGTRLRLTSKNMALQMLVSSKTYATIGAIHLPGLRVVHVVHSVSKRKESVSRFGFSRRRKWRGSSGVAQVAVGES